MVINHGGSEYVGKLAEQSKRVHGSLFILFFESDDQFAYNVAVVDLNAGDGGELLLDLRGMLGERVNENS
ncbi:MAG: hypothetical protein Q8N54_01895 [Sulfurimicrobium sp.]|jgi:hypothetical protein|nr:hypothetical protein [Sulfurimicrobium sp.]MDP2961479.1 hypothetical protein [Sulfurimicrobium sp.]MDP3687174.1 hypothetical protein [Sulfurimicrobium sp.]